MRMNKLVIVLILLALLLSACGGPTPTKGEVTVYVAAPLSGFQANGGQTVLGGARLAADEVNKAGGLLGYKVVVVGKDDESDNDTRRCRGKRNRRRHQGGQARARRRRSLQ